MPAAEGAAAGIARKWEGERRGTAGRIVVRRAPSGPGRRPRRAGKAGAFA